MAPKSKISRLPAPIREELNHRIRDGEPGKALVAWLNGQPAAQTLLATAFAGRQITEQNLSEWRKRGYRDWTDESEARELLHQSGHPEPPHGGPGPSVDPVMLWLSARYRVLAATPTAAMTPRKRLQLLLEITASFIRRRCDHFKSDSIRPNPTKIFAQPGSTAASISTSPEAPPTRQSPLLPRPNQAKSNQIFIGKALPPRNQRNPPRPRPHPARPAPRGDALLHLPYHRRAERSGSVFVPVFPHSPKTNAVTLRIIKTRA